MPSWMSLLSVVQLVPAIFFWCRWLINRRIDMPGGGLIVAICWIAYGVPDSPGARNSVSGQECQDAIVASADLINPAIYLFPIGSSSFEFGYVCVVMKCAAPLGKSETHRPGRFIDRYRYPTVIIALRLQFETSIRRVSRNELQIISCEGQRHRCRPSQFYQLGGPFPINLRFAGNLHASHPLVQPRAHFLWTAGGILEFGQIPRCRAYPHHLLSARRARACRIRRRPPVSSTPCSTNRDKSAV